MTDQGSGRDERTKAPMDELENRLEDVGIVSPPDGGVGWAVVFASFCTNALVDGVIFTVSATLLPRWERFFQSNAVTAATALLAGFYLLSGPLASALANSFGCNKVAIIGSLIAALGFLVSALVPALPVLYIGFGIIGGIGFGLVFLPAIVIVGQYFSERRALATGVAVCGSGIGTALFGQLNPILLRYFDSLTSEQEGWRLFLLSLSALTLLCAVFGYFFKPLRASKSQLEQVAKITAEFIVMEEPENMEKQPIPLTNANGNGSGVAEKVESPLVTQGVEIERFDKPATANSTAFAQRRRNTFSQRPFLSTLELLASRQALNKPSNSNANLALEVSKVGVTDLNRPLSRMDIFYAGSTLSLASRLKRGPADTVAEIKTAECDEKHARRSTLYLSNVGLQNMEETTSKPGFSPKWTRGILASLRFILDMSLLQSPTFLILAISGFLTLFCFFVPFAFIGALADECITRVSSSNGTVLPPADDDPSAVGEGLHQQQESNTQLLLVLLGLFNVAGRVLCGYVSDHPKVDPLIVSNFALIIGGLATAVAPFLGQLWMFALYCFPFAFGAASFAALRSIICVELLGIERLTSAFGMLMLFMGVAALLGPPFAKLLKNSTGSYALSFHIMGLLMTLSGIMCLPLRKINEWENSKSRASHDPNEAKEFELQPLKA